MSEERGMQAAEKDGLDWLLTEVMAIDDSLREHYFHINDGEGDACGCRREGEG